MKALQYFLFFIIVLPGCTAYSQKDDEVTRIEFTSVTRGYSRQMILSRDSVISILAERGTDPTIQKDKMKPQDWKNLMQSMRDIKLSEVPDLKSPTMKRAYDGAKHSTFSLTTQSGAVYIHSFDDEEPHEKFIPLMKVVSFLKKQ